MLQLKNIRKVYKTASESVEALRGVSISFRKSEFVSILGPSGCGKTTLLNIIGGLDHYTCGDLVINGKSTKSFRDRDWDVYRNHRVGFIFQSYNLIPHQTVLRNVELALTIAGIGRRERTRRAKAALDRVGLSDKYKKRPNQLSGGQCQRVAIARALVNDPEILLADEPTGALDTATSVQIMDLIAEISKERLVIMVTHNPELAQTYSNRIIRLLDGQVIEDTRPFPPEAEEAECRILKKQQQQKAGRRMQKHRETAKMSLLTAFGLSLRNLLSKKGRTAMVGFAGSIGIIGIAMVLAFSAGIKGYVASMQDDMLSGNPITITENTYDLDALTGMLSTAEKEEIIKENGKVYIESLVEYFIEMQGRMDSIMIKNDLTATYIDYVKAMPKEYYAAMSLGYGLDLSNNLYTDFRLTAGGTPMSLSVSALTNRYISLLKETDFSSYASFVSSMVPSFEEMPDNNDYIASQYNLTAGKLPTQAHEIVLVLDRNSRLSDLLLARLGYYTEAEFLAMIDKAIDSESFDQALYRDFFTHEELLAGEFVFHNNDAVFEKNTNAMSAALRPFYYRYDATDLQAKGDLTLKVVGILEPKETVSYGCLSSGIYHTAALTDYVLEQNRDSAIVKHLSDTETDSFQSMQMGNMSTGIYYEYTYTYGGEEKKDVAFVGEDASMAMMTGGMGGMGSGLSALRILSKNNLGGVDIANRVTIYPKDFTAKDGVTAYLDAWNDEGAVTVNGNSVAEADRADVTYTDTLSLVISLINTMIDVISYALIAFTSISLVVSTVMIGIITYVSVVERIKEIGVIRALGGRKKDVSHLFNAETLILGLLSGGIGVGATYLISAVANRIVYSLTGILQIAALPIGQAVWMILLSVFLTLISGLIPAASAARKDPVVALRTE